MLARRRQIATATMWSAVMLALSACGSDASSSATSDSAAAPGSPVETTAWAGENTAVTSAAPTLAQLSGRDLCDQVTAVVVGAALGLDITAATPYDESTPQCAYAYVSDSGATSNVSIAAMRPVEDLGGRVGGEAFDYVVQLNEMIGGAESETAEVDAGTQAARLSGASLHLGVIEIGGQVLTVIVPAGDATGSSVETLLRSLGEVIVAHNHP